MMFCLEAASLLEYITFILNFLLVAHTLDNEAFRGTQENLTVGEDIVKQTKFSDNLYTRIFLCFEWGA